MPEWLLKNENYIPAADRDTFINKSILSFMKVISLIKAQDGSSPDKFGVNAFFRVLFTLMLAVFISLSRTSEFIYIVFAYLLLLLCAMSGKDIIKILSVSITAMVFAVVILLPTAFSGNNYSIIIIPAKVFCTITAIGILSRSTRWDQIIGALKRFHLHDLVIFILDITLKYIVMLGEFAVEMLYALKLRSVGKNKSKYTSMSGVAGTMFLVSREMSEEMYSAMECRGFDGEYRIYQKFTFKLVDAVYLLINAGIITIFIYLY
jgi:cobalt/nickel transport system permease protein